MNSPSREFMARLAVMHDEDPVWKGVMAILDELREDVISFSSTVGHSGDDRAFFDGRQAAIEDVRGSLKAIRNRAQQTETTIV